MGEPIEEFGERMARAEQCFELSVLKKISYRKIALQLDISIATVSRDVAAYKVYLASERRGEDVEGRRSKLEAMLDDVYSKALEAFGSSESPLHKVAALNTISGLMTHYRALSGADAPKEVKGQVDTDVTIRWGE